MYNVGDEEERCRVSDVGREQGMAYRASECGRTSVVWGMDEFRGTCERSTILHRAAHIVVCGGFLQ